MEQKDYIDLDKINVAPVNGDIPGLEKEKVHDHEHEIHGISSKVSLNEKSVKSEEKINNKKAMAVSKNKVVKKVSKSKPKSKSNSNSNGKLLKNGNGKSSKSKKKSDSNNKVFFFVAISALVIAGLILAVWLLFFNDNNDVKPDTVAAMVNNVPIYESEITTLYNWFGSVLKSPVSRQDALDLNINVILFAQDAVKQGFVVSDDDVNDLYLQVSLSNYMYPDDFKVYLESIGVNNEHMLVYFKNWMLSRELLDSLPLSKITEQEISGTYDTIKGTLMMPERVKVRHIFFLYSDSEVADLEEAQRVLSLINENKSNFCDLVLEYSDDIQSANSCGEYTFGYESGFEDNFLESSFEMEEDELRIVKSQVGYHIIYKVEHMDSKIPSLDESRDYIIELLEQEKILVAYEELMISLTSKSIIEIYDSKYTFYAQGADKVDEAELEFEVELVDETESTETVEVISTPSETLIKVQEPVSIPTKTIVETDEARLLGLAKCLNDKVKVYNVYWSSDSARQLEMFGDYVIYIKSYECDPSAPAYNQSECSVLQKQFPTWPTWIINGNVYEGIQSLQRLAEYSGCSY